MPHIDLPTDAPGIRGLFNYRPQTALPMSQLAEVLLRGEHSLSRGERELIATYVSSLNDCAFCSRSHAAFAAAQLPGGMDLVRQVTDDPDDSPVSDKMKALLDIAGAVQRGGLEVTPDHVQAARKTGATDVEIHDTVLIAAAFCMYNRYVDGLAALTPDEPTAYKAMADFIVAQGYLAAEPPAG
ncbi:peroxidase-related enzyme [Streptosporangium sp. NBC_01639]|uniref:carboxymuconolactone decarboxylase family protein n=1 Tax=unclassified Streptosporangium TaxID=2632669 RepID=UPI002DD8DADA|nr:peroxidase-related enzyme [Streptosporangium sp. NBC_01756]WSC86002.1 peroxidase-related enzyme [Streptosporangium sp. NBC_01756]WTD55325.1 peroxidase-related enzyme [Streptosporangium sp. NBC_01639]